MAKNLYSICFYKLFLTGLIPVCMYINVYSQIMEPAPVTELIERWKSYNLNNPEVSGWRIQLLATVDRRQVETEQRSFESRYPEYPTHVVNNQPYFHLKTGAFLTSQKARAFLKKLQHDYPAAIIVEDVIKNEEFLLYDQ